MKTTRARAEHADRPPSTSGTPNRRARRWSLVAGILAVGSLALAAPMASADPASGTDVAVAAKVATSVPPASGSKVGTTYTKEEAAKIKAFAEAYQRYLVKLWVARTNWNRWMAAAVAYEKKKAAAYPHGLCGGDLPPCYVMMRESRGNITARNPRSSASGKWQFIDSTWAGFGGYAHAYQAPEKVQDAKARQMWANGRGCGHWSAC